MTDSALLKVNRATERIDELNKLFRSKRPFAYVLETNTQTRERATRAKKDDAVVNEAALIAGDAIQNLRSALDHTYWAIVSPFATSPREERAIQFPFSESANRLDKAVKNRLAHRVSQRFFDAIIALAPHGETGGNRLLFFIDRLNAPDKHRALLPTASYRRTDGRLLKRQIPDFPMEIGPNVFMGGGGRDFVWRASQIDSRTLGTLRTPSTCMFEKQIIVPMDIVFEIAVLDGLYPMIPTLNKMADVCRETIRIIRAAV